MSKTKTALGLAALLSPFALLLFAIWSQAGTIRNSLLQAAVASNTAAAVLVPLASITLWTGLLFGLTVIMAVAFVFLFANATSRPLRAMSQALRQADISQDLPASGASGQICRDYNSFIKKVREILAHTRKLGLEVAVGSTGVAGAVKDLRAKSRKNAELSDAIFFASTDMKIKIVDVSAHTHSLQEATAVSLSTANSQLGELRKVTAAIERTGKSASHFSQTIRRLTTTSLRIKELVNLIEEISGQIHSLALRAGMEVSRAGDKGTRFAEIAGEMKHLAERANAGSGSQILVDLSGMVREVNNLGEDIHKDVQQVDQAIGSTVRHFAELVSTFEDDKERLSGIAAAVDQMSSENVLIHTQVVEIRKLSKQVEDILTSSAQSATSMNRKTEALLEAVAYFKIGNDPLEEKISAVAAYRDRVQSVIADMAKRGVNIFDHNYQMVPNTNPQKYHTAYDAYFQKELQPLFDAAIKEMDNIYCVAVDTNGYIASHHSKVSKPLTGDFEVDLIYSRDRRIYDSNETEVRRVKHTNSFLLQTYMRDTGEILNDLSMPITVNGKHWGALVSGFQPERIMTTGRRAAFSGK